MPVPDFQDGVAPSISELDVWLTEQVIATVTAAGRPANGTPGRVCFETDTNRFIRDDGTGWLAWDQDWQSYTPTLTNLTLGNGTRMGAYKRRWEQCLVKFMFTLGSSSAVGTSPQFTLPFDYDDPDDFDGGNTLLAPVTLLEAGVGSQMGMVRMVAALSPDAVQFVTLNSAGTNLTPASVSATSPFTWGTADRIEMPQLLYDVAAADWYV